MKYSVVHDLSIAFGCDDETPRLWASALVQCVYIGAVQLYHFSNLTVTPRASNRYG